MTNTEKIREEWSQEVDKEMPIVLIVDGEKEIADWWLNKMAQALAEERESVNNKIEEYFDGLIVVSLPQATKESLLESLKDK